jgi:hypothetical protein
MRQAFSQSFQNEMGSEGLKPSTVVLSGIDERGVSAYLGVLLDTMRALRGEAEFWCRLGPAFRVRFEDFQSELATMRVTLGK